ncbi:hypothetical protein ENBRE01_3084 [Enteropsectra breve]|nr:hypothetical protein ENBRE01_3084 [Enteropsectra breve]
MIASASAESILVHKYLYGSKNNGMLNAKDTKSLCSSAEYYTTGFIAIPNATLIVKECSSTAKAEKVIEKIIKYEPLIKATLKESLSLLFKFYFASNEIDAFFHFISMCRKNKEQFGRARHSLVMLARSLMSTGLKKISA